tara:strand:- start:181 stop:450 length:270 start_codon:yes stop_codon:yes gene_type:complete
MSKFIMRLDYEIDGTPCLIGVTNYEHFPPVSSDPRQCHSDLEYYGYSEIDYVVLDENGEPEHDLQDKVNATIHDDIIETIEVIAAHEIN